MAVSSLSFHLYTAQKHETPRLIKTSTKYHNTSACWLTSRNRAHLFIRHIQKFDMGEPNGVNGRLTNGHGDENGYSVPSETLKVFKNAVLANPLIAKDLPPEIKEASAPIHVVGSDSPSVPVNYRFAEGIASLKVLEAALVNVLLKRKYGLDPQSATIDTDHAILFVMSSILWTLDPSGLNFSPGSTRSVPELEKYFPSYDKHRRDVSAYRSAATNIYKCADGKYFHTHGSLNPDPTQDSLELPHDFEASNYDEAIKPYMEAMSRIKGQEMDNKYNNTYKQAGTLCYTADEFRASEHGKANSNVGLWEIHDKPNPSQPPSWWPDSPQTGPARPLAGLKVVDLTRIIAAPTVTRSLAELGASVMRCTSPNLPDVNSLHVDLNWGKWNCSINLHDEADREKLRQLIKEADVVVQAYRPGALDKYGFSQDDILKMCENRSTGIIHVRENCYGWNGPWQGRSGWQQISDAVSLQRKT